MYGVSCPLCLVVTFFWVVLPCSPWHGMQAEAGNMERYVRAEDYAALEQQRDELNARVLELEEELARKLKALEEANKEVRGVKRGHEDDRWRSWWV